MRTYIAFMKKEFMEMSRNGKLLAIGIIFLLVGLMNPALAKLTPEIMKYAAESMEDAGIVFVDPVVNDLTSWQQFYKNVPTALIIFLILFSGIITSEYQKGTIIPMYTKGISPTTMFFSKYTAVLISWTAAYCLTFYVTYFYNNYFWGNDVTKNIVFSALCVYVLGIFLMSVMMLMSTICNGNTTVIVATAIVFIIIYLCGMIPNVNNYLPTKLMNTNELLIGSLAPNDYMAGMLVTLAAAFVSSAFAGVLIRRKAV